MRTHERWSFSNNPFINAKLSYEDWNVLGSDHLSKLENKKDSHPMLEHIYDNYKEVYEVYLSQYKNWKLAKQYWQAETLEVDNLLEELSSKWIKNWDMRIQLVFDDTSPEYTSLLPNKRSPFQRTRRDERIVEVGTLIRSLSNYSSLSDLRQEVTNFYQTFKAKRDHQQKREQAVRDASTSLKQAAEKLGIATYRNVGNLIAIYAEEPNQLLNFFKLDLIRSVKRVSGNVISDGDITQDAILEDGVEDSFGVDVQ